MQPSIRFDHTVVALEVEGTVHVMVELTAPEAPASQRPPIDVMVVIDRSGSMDGGPLASVIEATCGLLRVAGADDRIGVVSFDSEVRVELPLDHHDADRAAMALRRIRSGGATNLSGGWLKALEVLTDQARPGALTRIVLLTDGQANHGIVDEDRLATMAGGAAGKGVSTSCIGFGANYSEGLLAAMANAGRGNDYWCAGPDQAAAVFTSEFEGLVSVVAQNVSVELRPGADVLELLVLNEFPITRVADGVQVALGDAYGGERRRVVAMLRLAPQLEAGQVAVGEAVIRWVSVGDDTSLHAVTIPLLVNAGGDPDTADADVVEQVLVLRAAREQAEAHREIERGNFERASQLLGDAAEKLRHSSLPDHDHRVHELRAEIDRLNVGHWDNASSKRLYSSSRGASRGRKSRFDADEKPGES
jgi:Ca-activated chloride channel family protein